MMLSSTTTSCCAPARRAPRPHRLSVTCFLGSNKSQQQPAAVSKTVRVQKPASNSNPPELVREERESLAAALKDAGLPPNASATELSPDAIKAVLSTISSGLDKKEEDLPKLEGAMLLAEQLFHASAGGKGLMAAAAGVAGAAPQAVDMWQPIFASAGGFPRLLYIPVPEYFDMHRSLPDATAISISSMTDTIDTTTSPERALAAAGPGAGRLNIITELGPLTTHFLGSCAWLDDTTFEYSISSIRLDLGGRSVSFGLGPFKLENQLSFFLVTPEVACARSKLGGTMLLAPEPARGKAHMTSW